MKNKDLLSLTGLVVRRMPRLGIPVFFSAIIIFLIMKSGFMRNYEASALFGETNTWFSGFYNFIPTVRDMIKSIPGVFLVGNSKYNAVLWTMRYEFFGSYYIVLFLVALHYSDIYKKTAVWIISTIGLLYILPQIACFNFGMLIAFLFADKKEFIDKIHGNNLIKVSLIISIGICYGLNLFAEQIGMYRLQGILSAISAFLIVLSLVVINVFQKFFSSKVSRFLGKLSFPLYIVHLPIICSFTAFLMIRYNHFQQNIGVAVIIYSVTALLSIITACFFYPIEKLSIWVSQKTYLFMVNKNKKKNGV